MNFKIDTKEKFTVIALLDTDLNDNMAVDLKKACTPYLEAEVKNVVLNMHSVITISSGIAQTIALLQQSFYEGNASFVICQISSGVNEVFEREELDDILNCTPSESEAWDIVQMEEIERELLDGNDFLFED